MYKSAVMRVNLCLFFLIVFTHNADATWSHIRLAIDYVRPYIFSEVSTPTSIHNQTQPKNETLTTVQDENLYETQNETLSDTTNEISTDKPEKVRNPADAIVVWDAKQNKLVCKDKESSVVVKCPSEYDWVDHIR